MGGFGAVWVFACMGLGCWWILGVRGLTGLRVFLVL